MKRIILFFLFITLLPASAPAHWCSNIYQSYARIVVKPDRDRIDVAVGENKELKVRVRNNFPYTLHYIKLRANPPEGLSVTVTPDQSTAERIRVMAGQVLTFTLQITRDAEGTDEVSDLNLEIATTVEDIQPDWRDSTDDWVNQEPDPQVIRDNIADNGFQALSLNYDTLAAYGGNDSGVKDRIQQMAESDPDGICTFDPSPRAQRLAKAALLVLGERDQHADVTACYNDESEDTRVRLLCAAALGMKGEDAPMIDFVLPHTTDGKNTSYEGQYTAYLVQLVTYDRRGGPDGSGEATFLDEEPLPQEPGDGGCGCGGTNRPGLLLLLLFIPALLRPRVRNPDTP